MSNAFGKMEPTDLLDMGLHKISTCKNTHTRALGAAGGLQKEQCWDKAGLRERAEVTKGGFLVTEASPESSPVTSNKKFFKKGESSSSKFLFK